MSEPFNDTPAQAPSSITFPRVEADQLINALRWRYATKAFDPTRTITPEIWEKLEQALILSPSSFGLQPYRFLVVTDPALREQLLPHSWNQRQVVEASHYVIFAARTSLTEADIDAYVELIARTRGVSPAALGAYRAMMTGTLLTDQFRPQLGAWAAHQAYIALGNLLTCAALMGVDACPMEGFDPAAYDQILGLRQRGLFPAVCCALGYRAETDKAARLVKVRFPRQQLIQHL